MKVKWGWSADEVVEAAHKNRGPGVRVVPQHTKYETAKEGNVRSYSISGEK